MLELMQRLIAFKYACKLNHWKTDSYAKHLLFDRLQEDLDELVDRVGEEYFMANGKKSELTEQVLNPKYINADLVQVINDINSHIEQLLQQGQLTSATQGLLGSITEALVAKLALLTLK